MERTRLQRRRRDYQFDLRSILSAATNKADEYWDEVIGAWPAGDTAGDLEDAIAALTNGGLLRLASSGSQRSRRRRLVSHNHRRPVSADNTLSALSVSGARLSPSFTSDVTSYTASVGYTVTQITVTATENDAGATATSRAPPTAIS